MAERLAIIGAGGHGRVVAEAALASGGFAAVVFLDSRPELAGQRVLGLPVAGAGLDLLSPADYAVHVAIGDNAARERLGLAVLAAGFALATVVHPAATLSRFARLGPGAVVMAGAVVNCGTEIGEGVIVNTGARIDHDCRLAPWSHVSPGAVLPGAVRLGRRSWIGAGAVCRDRVRIGDDVVVGVGAVVVGDLEGAGRCFVGVPARPLERDPAGPKRSGR